MARSETRPVDRLRSNGDIRRVMRTGARRARHTVTLHVTAANHDRIRFTPVASKRIGSAVDRNRAKRLLREAGRRVAWLPGIDVVAVARTGIAGASMMVVHADMSSAASELGVVS